MDVDRVELARRARRHLVALCAVEPDRRPGGAGNRQATDRVQGELARLGWVTSSRPFDCLDWSTDGGTLTVGSSSHEIVPSPYGHGVAGSGPLKIVHTVAEVDAADLRDSVLVLDGEIASEPLTPLRYPFFSNEAHDRISQALIDAAPLAIVAVTDRFPEWCGAVVPFPLIEDGDFPVPAAAMRPEVAMHVSDRAGETAEISLRSTRRLGSACNVEATRGPRSGRVLVIGHVDSKPGTPGAVDNASGVVVLLLVAALLADRPPAPVGVELLAVNGEDHYAAPGEVAWLAEHGDHLDDIELVVNVDGAGYRHATTSYSTYGLDPRVDAHVRAVFERSSIPAGPPWTQSDHAVFAMRGRPAVALTSEPIAAAMSTIFHTADDTPDRVEPDQLVDAAIAIAELIDRWPVDGDEPGDG